MPYLSKISHIPLYQAELLSPYSERLIHGFTGKPLSFGGPDTEQNPRARVLRNRQNLLAEFGMDCADWIIPEQVHGHRVGRSDDRHFLQTDAVLLRHAYQPAMLLFADCVPILLYDPIRHGGVVIHAGWRGTAQQIAREALLSLRNTLGSKPEDVLTIVGPAISLCCFQVSVETAQQIAMASQLTLSDLEEQNVLAWDKDYPQNPRLDLKVLNRNQLIAMGVEQIETFPQCTHCHEAEFFSFRRNEAGRNSAWMILLE